MERNPIRSPLMQYFVNMHEIIFLRRRIIKDYSSDVTIPYAVTRMYGMTMFMTILSLYLVRSERIAEKVLIAGGLFGTSVLNIHFRYERDLFTRTAMEDTKIGAVFRQRYTSAREGSPTAQRFMRRSDEILELEKKYGLRKDPLKKFNKNYFSYARSGVIRLLLSRLAYFL